MTHDGVCNNCNGGMTAQQSILCLTAIAAAGVIGIVAVNPHGDNSAIITIFVGAVTTTLAQMIGVNKTQEVHKALCETAKQSSADKAEIKDLVIQDLATTTAVKDIIDKRP